MQNSKSQNNNLDNPAVKKRYFQDTSKKVVATLFDVIEAHGVEDIVCSPGSRNAPLLMAARARADIRKHIVIDERSAGFMALGIASVKQKPVALVCTSGTALLNYAPAVAEAYYQGIPLIVISADRPLEWIDQDDSQTLRQFDALRNFVKGSYELNDREQHDHADWYDNRVSNDAMLTALRPKKGPVHINIRLSPPLDSLIEFKQNHLSPIRLISQLPEYAMPEKETIKDLAAHLIGKKILVTVGFMLPDARLNKALLKFRSHPNVTIMAETISNTHLPAEDYSVDSVLCDIPQGKKEQFAPDIVISFGGALVSRMLKDFLRECGSNDRMQHWSVGPAHTTVDCFQSLTLRIEANPGLFLSQLSAELAHQRRLLEEEKFKSLSDEKFLQLKKAENYNENFFRLKELANQRIFRFATQISWSELIAYIDIFNNIPKNYNLFLSNGTTIRYAQLIPYELPHASYCNRGVSGIEGSTSVAVGGDVSSEAPALLVTGDMSLAHDLNGLALASAMNSSLKIIVINNMGGGIFRFVRNTSNLPGREEYFCADPGLHIKALAEAFGFEYSSADSLETLRARLESFFEEDSLSTRKILEVYVPGDKSALYLRQFLRLSNK
ncbi:MAG: 2-succinyl-5-enolpyruvyl-6-hydroxy-3-cyclohexene-1-carboxylic-acid synthase [Muribaculaceae bacterium]|nr:2-succinyl-5-enolpyruvyl-6-hydroxy-3-cyclohexene-1-carboxylic-acid synthase [Muribaculaceae bacterium]